MNTVTLQVARYTMDSKIDISVEIRPKSPDLNLETGVDVSVVGNTQQLLFSIQPHWT